MGKRTGEINFVGNHFEYISVTSGKEQSRGVFVWRALMFS